uniref:Pacifastin domain-containing protein n=1 Tax=Clastoptera arizonana TaxID=38151 RepID=A0A1B6CEA2_9HEMI
MFVTLLVAVSLCAFTESVYSPYNGFNCTEGTLVTVNCNLCLCGKDGKPNRNCESEWCATKNNYTKTTKQKLASSISVLEHVMIYIVLFFLVIVILFAIYSRFC